MYDRANGGRYRGLIPTVQIDLFAPSLNRNNGYVVLGVDAMACRLFSFKLLSLDHVTPEEIVFLHSVTNEFGMCRL
jgi:hypothetical protein